MTARAPAYEEMAAAMTRFRRFLLYTHHLGNVSNRPHLCWEERDPITGKHTTTSLLYGPLRLWGCTICGRTHMCRGLAHLDRDALRGQDTRLWPDPCPMQRVWETGEYVCSFSGAIVEVAYRTNTTSAGSYGEAMEQKASWRSRIHEDGEVSGGEDDEGGGLANLGEGSDDSEGEDTFGHERFQTRPDYHASVHAFERSGFQLERKVVNQMRSAMDASARINGSIRQARQQHRLLASAVAITARNGHQSVPELGAGAPTLAQLASELLPAVRRPQLHVAPTIRTSRAPAPTRSQTIPVPPRAPSSVPGQSAAGAAAPTPAPRPRKRQTMFRADQKATRAGAPQIDVHGHVNLGAVTPAPRDLAYWRWFVFRAPIGLRIANVFCDTPGAAAGEGEGGEEEEGEEEEEEDEAARAPEGVLAGRGPEDGDGGGDDDDLLGVALRAPETRVRGYRRMIETRQPPRAGTGTAVAGILDGGSVERRAPPVRRVFSALHWCRRHESLPRFTCYTAPPALELVLHPEWLDRLHALLSALIAWARTAHGVESPPPATLDDMVDVMARWTRLVFLTRPALDVAPVVLLGLYFFDLGLRTLEMTNGIGEVYAVLHANPYAQMLRARRVVEQAYLGEVLAHNPRVRQAIMVEGRSAIEVAVQQARKRVLPAPRAAPAPPARETTVALGRRVGERKGGAIQHLFAPPAAAAPARVATMENINGRARPVAFAPHARCTMLQIHELKEAFEAVITGARHAAPWFLDWFHHDRWRCWPPAVGRGSGPRASSPPELSAHAHPH